MIREAVTVQIDKHYMDYLASTREGRNGGGEVIMVLPRPGGKVLVSSKYFYPEGVFRLPTGGINPIESPEEAFERETWEETGLVASIERKIAVIVHHCTNGSDRIDITSHVFLGSETSATPEPKDARERIREFMEVDARGLLVIADQLRGLFGRWQGFGRFRADAHDLVAHCLLQDHMFQGPTR